MSLIMMRSRLSLRSLASPVLSLVLFLVLFSGCTSSTKPTYLKEDIAGSVQDICLNEYKLYVRSRLVGRTLWVYVPLEDMFTKSDKPEKYIERFKVDQNNDRYEFGLFHFDYSIKQIPEEEKSQQIGYKKEASESINNTWKVLRRVLFSMDHASKTGPQFFCLVVADIKNGIELREIFNQLDMKKVSYEFISWGEYQHRTIQDTGLSDTIIGDKEGNHLDYHDIGFEEFISAQIKHRINLKFQKPEVEHNVDIDKEIIKIIVYTFRIYGVKQYQGVELNNLLTKNKITLNQAAILSKFIE